MIKIPLFNEKGIVLIDDIDSRLLKYSWHVHVSGTKTYARAWVNGRREYMHRMIISADLVDHINRDGLDNRRENLRPATKSLNAINSGVRIDNTTGEKNISLNRNSNKYVVETTRNGTKHYIGYYSELSDAIEARDIAINRLDFPEKI
jgi:hypothetical protein